MAAVTIRVGGRDWRVACDDGQEERLRVLADEVDERVRSLIFSAGESLSDNMALLLTALTMADEIAELKEENSSLRANGGVNVAVTGEDRVREMEEAMAATLEEIAGRIEKIAREAEIR